MFTIGIDYGSLSGRVVLVDTDNGNIVATYVYEYPHAIMDCVGGKSLGDDWALQHPKDYIEVLEKGIPFVIEQSKVSPSDIKGIGIDFTASTIMPIKKDGTPLCFLEEFKNNPHAYVKLWKHHSAQKYADRINSLAAKWPEDILSICGGVVSSEWLLPKSLQILEEAPEIYSACDKIIEAGDWITYLLTGVDLRNSCAAGYKGQYTPENGYYSPNFLKKLDNRLPKFVEEKLNKVIPSGAVIGGLTKEMADRLGLKEGIGVAAATIDAHASVPACGISEENQLLIIMGTSSCHMLLSKQNINIKGVCGIIKDGILPDFYGYEAGQCCVGDHFQWVVDQITPERYFKEAEEKGLTVMEYLSLLAAKREVDVKSPVALDWWNGVRSVLMDSALKGVLSGMNLKTTVVDIFASLIEATAFGTRKIVETFEKGGISVNKIVACGGIAKKNSFFMQTYANILGKEISVVKTTQASAIGSAIFGAVAGGVYNSINEAVNKMASSVEKVYYPNNSTTEKYDLLYKKYNKLHDFFGKKIKGFLFDMDGVLVDSEQLITKAIIEVLDEKFNLKVKYSDFLEFTGMGEERFIGGVVEKYGRKYELSMKKDAYDRYAEIADEYLTVYTGVESTIKNLSKANFRLAVCSSSDLVKVEINLNKCGIRKYFNQIITGSDIKRKKPYPDIFKLGAAKLGLDTNECVVVEDALTGVIAAKAAGCFTIAVTTSFSKEELLAVGADIVIDDISEILSIIE